MKKIIALLLVLVLLVACNLPINIGDGTSPTPIVIVVTSEPPATPIPSLATATAFPAPTKVPVYNTMEGVTALASECLVSYPLVDIVEAHLPADYPGPAEIWPEHRSIIFAGYPISGTFFDPIVRIMPIDTYPVVDTLPASRVSDLQNLLEAKPFTSTDQLPFLPVFYANQAFRLKMDYLSFQNGEGVRFLTEYAQYMVPMNNHDMFYTFQGMTSDGKYWISAIFPINHAILPASADSTSIPAGGRPIPDWNSPTFDTDFITYYDEMSIILNGLADDSFTPSITCLDEFIQSLKIED